MNDDDFTDDWAAILPSPKPVPPPSPPGVIEPGYLWLGLFDADIEVSCQGYARQRVAIPPGRSMVFEATWLQIRCSVQSVGLFLSATGNQVVWMKDTGRLHTNDLDTTRIVLTIEDAPPDYAEWAGFRKVLKLYGVL